MSNDGKALKSGLWYTISNFLINGLNFLITPLFTRMMTKAEFGDYNNYVSWLAIVTVIVTLNLESTMISARYDFENDFDDYISSMLLLSSISIGIWWIIANIFSGFFTDYFGMPQYSINIMFGYLMLLPAINLYIGRERYNFAYKKTVIISLIQALSIAGLSIALVYFMNDKVLGRILGASIGPIVIGLWLYYLIIKKGKKIQASYWKYALKVCIPFIPHLLSLVLLNSMDRVMIKKICGAEDTALYSVAYTCGYIVTIFLNAINSAFAPWLGEKLALKEYGDIKKFSKKYVGLFAGLVLGIMLFSPEIVLILGGKKYLVAQYAIPPIIMGCMCQFLYVMFVNVEQFEKKTIGMAFASVSAALLNYVTNSIFIPKYGYVAAAYTTLAGYLWLLIVHMFLVYRLKLSKVYDYKLVIFVALIGVLVTGLITFIYSYTLIRLVLCGIYLIVVLLMLFKYKSIIMKFLRKT